MTGIPNYDVERPREYGSLHAQPEPDAFSHESPIRAFTNWSVAGNYAIGKGFRPSLAHVATYLDALDRLEGWALLQILEAASGSPSFVFRRGEGSMPSDTRRLVIAARTIAFSDWDGDSEEWATARKELDDASEAFASRVPWEDEQ